jgi:hypothetical protein
VNSPVRQDGSFARSGSVIGPEDIASTRLSATIRLIPSFGVLEAVNRFKVEPCLNWIAEA